ncbi:MAG: apolipoprotein N-acyltransferase [Sphaerochaetaceae bacterium]
MKIYKRRNFLTFLFELSLILFSAALYSLSFPGYFSYEGFGFLGIIALIPMFIAIRHTTLPLSFLFGFIFGFVFYLLFNYWLATFHPLAIFIGPIFKGFEFMILFPFLYFVNKVLKKRSYLFLSIFMTAFYYLGSIGFAGYPYGTLGYSFYNYPVLIQSASLFGVWGITFLMLIPQAFFGNYLGDKNFGISVKFHILCKDFGLDILVYLMLCVATVGFGFYSINKWSNATPSKMVKITAVQHNADSWIGGYSTYKKNFENLSELSIQALDDNPDMIVWSETAFVPSVAWHTAYPTNQATSNLVNSFVEFGENLPVPLITGNTEGALKDESLPPTLSDGDWNRKSYNTVILFGNGKILGTYRKQHLVPFSEHFPYQKQFPKFTQFLINNDYKWWEKGTEETVFNYKGLKFSTTLCFEDIFGSLNAGFVKNGADLLINLSNDSWSKSVSAETQHIALSTFRAVENRKSELRSSNSGISALIKPTGEIVDPMEPFVMDYHTYDVPIYSHEDFKPTFYTLYSDLFAYLMLLITVFSIIFGFIVYTIKKKQKKNYEEHKRDYPSIGQDYDFSSYFNSFSSK